MSTNLLTRAAIPPSIGDRGAMAIAERLASDSVLRSLFRVERCHVLAPASGARGPRIVVSALRFEETLGLSQTVDGSFSVGVLVEFEHWRESLSKDEISMDSLLAYIRRVVEGIDANGYRLPGGYYLTGPGGERLNCGPPKWATITVEPEREEGALFYVGMEVSYRYKAATVTGEPLQ